MESKVYEEHRRLSILDYLADLVETCAGAAPTSHLAMGPQSKSAHACATMTTVRCSSVMQWTLHVRPHSRIAWGHATTVHMTGIFSCQQFSLTCLPTMLARSTIYMKDLAWEVWPKVCTRIGRAPLGSASVAEPRVAKTGRCYSLGNRQALGATARPPTETLDVARFRRERSFRIRCRFGCAWLGFGTSTGVIPMNLRTSSKPARVAPSALCFDASCMLRCVTSLLGSRRTAGAGTQLDE